MDNIRLLDLGIIPYARTQAIYHAVAATLTEDSPDTLILCAPDRAYFCVGFHQEARQELDLDFCRVRNLPVMRRRVGGGTTYLDAPQPFYQLILHHRRAPAMVNALYQFALAAPVETLRALGLNAELRGANEMLVNGKRIAGIGAGRIGEASVVVGNFLGDFDYATMARAWRVPNEKYRGLAREGMEFYITTLRREMQSAPTPESIHARLIEKYAATLKRPLARGTLTRAEAELAAQLESELQSDAWLFETERLRAFGMDGMPRRKLKIADGVFMHHAAIADIEISARVRAGVIDALAIQSANGAQKECDAVARVLVGAKIERYALEARLGDCCSGREHHFAMALDAIAEFK